MNGLLVIDVFGSLRGNKSADDLDSVEHVNKYAGFVVLRFLYRFPTVGSSKCKHSRRLEDKAWLEDRNNRSAESLLLDCVKETLSLSPPLPGHFKDRV